MKNPFRFFQSHGKKPAEEIPPAPAEELPAEEPPAPEPDEPDDGFTEWCRSVTHGGIERRERNDIYEAYSVYGCDADGRLICRQYHRYPEHERDFDLSYSRVLSFTEFNKRLFSELDRGGVKLSDYHACIEKAEALCDFTPSAEPIYTGFSEEETAVLRDFCESNDTLTDKEYRTAEGIFRCVCRSIVGDKELNLWFRKPLARDALDEQTAGVSRTPIEGYDIESMWIMGVYNRLRERCKSCTVIRLTYDWSPDHETVCLMQANGFNGIDGALLIAVADAAAFPKFGFYSLDFANR